MPELWPSLPVPHPHPHQGLSPCRGAGGTSSAEATQSTERSPYQGDLIGERELSACSFLFLLVPVPGDRALCLHPGARRPAGRGVGSERLLGRAALVLPPPLPTSRGHGLLADTRRGPGPDARDVRCNLTWIKGLCRCS